MLIIDKYGSIPIYEQIIDGIEKEILHGMLCEGDAISSVRELSVQLGINPNTIQKAYIELDRRGVIFPTPRGSFVREGAVSVIRENVRKKMYDLRGMLSELRLAGVSAQELYHEIDMMYQTKEDVSV